MAPLWPRRSGDYAPTAFFAQHTVCSADLGPRAGQITDDRGDPVHRRWLTAKHHCGRRHRSAGHVCGGAVASRQQHNSARLTARRSRRCKCAATRRTATAATTASGSSQGLCRSAAGSTAGRCCWHRMPPLAVRCQSIVASQPQAAWHSAAGSMRWLMQQGELCWRAQLQSCDRQLDRKLGSVDGSVRAREQWRPPSDRSHCMHEHDI